MHLILKEESCICDSAFTVCVSAARDKKKQKRDSVDLIGENKYRELGGKEDNRSTSEDDPHAITDEGREGEHER